MKHHLGYLSAAPRVSTRPEAILGGPRSHVLGIINAFESSGWQVTPFIVGDKVPVSWIDRTSDHNITRSRFHAFVADLMRMAMGTINRRQAWHELGHEVDWVYERFAAYQSLGSIFKRHGTAWILETNAPLFVESKHDRKTLFLSSLAKRLEIKAYRGCDVLVCISEDLKHIITNETDVPADKIFVMPNGVDTSFFNPERYQAQRTFAEFTIGFVGSLIEWQGLDSLLEVLAELRANGLDIKLVLVGDGPARLALEDRVKDLGLSAAVHFTGYVARGDVPPLIAGFDVGYSGQVPLSIGRMYLSPLKLYEYMAMAKPVIASDFADARMVVDNDTGFLFSGGNVQELNGAIQQAYHSRAHLKCMGAKARERVIREHSWQARVTSLIHFLGSQGEAVEA